MKRILKLSLLFVAGAVFLGRLGAVYAQNSLAYTPASMFIWTDKYAYLPGEPITLRWTARANADATPYTAVVYRQNNQTGLKTYMSIGGAPSTTAVDIFGRTSEQGFNLVTLGDVTKGVMIGSGGWLQSSASAPSGELGMHTFVIEIRDSTGTRVIKSAYTKIGVVDSIETISGNIDSDRTLVNTRAYRLSGSVIVRSNAVLTIQPGTFIFGMPGSQPASVLIVGVNGRIMAEGTRNRPIIMTSNQPIGQRAAGDWGGLSMLGKAPVNVTGGTANLEGLAPSADTTYGGSDAAHSCGTLAYVRVEFAGALLSPNNELNAITWAGCGTGTVAHHLQSRYGLDDMFEWFGGTANAKYLVGSVANDDFLDGQLGWSGKVQHGIMVAGRDRQGNRGIEMDNSEFDDRAQPQGKPQIYNVTFVGVGDQFTTGPDEADSSALYFRRGAGGAYNNLLLYNWIVNGISVRNNTNSTATTDSITRGDLSMDGILMFDNGKASNRANDIAGQASDFGTTVNAVARELLGGTRGQGRNVMVGDPRLRRPLYGSDPDFLPRAGSPVFRANWVQPPDDGFFDQWARWNGGFGDVDWTEEWTCFHVEGDLAP